MLNNSASTSRPVQVARILLILFFWLITLALAHHSLHIFAQDKLPFFDHPILKFLAATIGLSIVIYLIIRSLPGIETPRWKGSLTIIIWSMMIVIVHGATHLGENNAKEVLKQLQDMMGLSGFILLACIYAVFLAMPFVPGVEIGLLIMATFGVQGVLVAYSGTIIGLNLAFGVGRMLPASLIQKWLQRIGFKPRSENIDDQLVRLVKGKNWLSQLGDVLLQNRYVTIALCLNIPGNSLIGGGGGISLLSGLSQRLVSRPGFLLVTVIATLPIPLLVLVGFLNIDGFVAHSGWLHDFLNSFYSWISLS